LHTEQLSNKP